jgi:undecaprenyl-diphosphatase
MFTHPLTLTLLAFACTSVLSLLSLKIIGKHLESLIIMGTAFIVGGIVMWWVDDRYGSRPSGDVESIAPGQAIWIGICQTLAPIFPGTSRSMATIAAGELAGLSRTTSLEFSFLLSIPTMAAASCFDLFRTLHPSHSAEPTPPVLIDGHGWVLLAIGFVVSFFVAWGVVAWFLNWVRTRGFAPFAIYRILLGIAVLVWAART